jgi:hypothetical protein
VDLRRKEQAKNDQQVSHSALLPTLSYQSTIRRYDLELVEDLARLVFLTLRSDEISARVNSKLFSKSMQVKRDLVQDVL